MLNLNNFAKRPIINEAKTASWSSCKPVRSTVMSPHNWSLQQCGDALQSDQQWKSFLLQQGGKFRTIWQLEQEEIEIRAVLCCFCNGICLVFWKQQRRLGDKSELWQWALINTFLWELNRDLRHYQSVFISFSRLVNCARHKTQAHTHAALSADIQTRSLAQGHTSVWSVWSERLCETEKRLPN